MNRGVVLVGIVLTLGASAMGAEALAQGSARSLDLDPSVRASAMGGASNAVFWDGANAWANPALLGGARGIAYEWGNTRLVPGLADDVHFVTNVVKLGGGGLGVALSGRPGIGGLRLDYGESEGTDDQGNVTGMFSSFEDIDSWGFGLSLGSITESVAKLLGHDAPVLSRYGDVSLGWYSKHADISLGPAPAGQSSTSAHDRGVLVRLSPLEWSSATRDAPLDIDLAYGWSELSYDGEPAVFLNEDSASPPSRHRRTGYAVRAGVDWPEPMRRVVPLHDTWWFDGFSPLIAVGFASDHDDISAGSSYETDAGGTEITVANIATMRFGSYQDLTDTIDGSTSGWGVGLPVGRFGVVRYDWARFPQPQASGLPDLKRKAFSAWVDPLEIWAALHR